MIEEASGNVLKADAEALVNTVNCVGVMGRGIALQFRQAYPENYRAYKTACDGGAVIPGEMLVHEMKGDVNPRYIINFPTKRHWKNKSLMDDIDSGLEALVETVRSLAIRSVAIPPLGCGLGGLKWSEVKPRIEKAFSMLPAVQVLLYSPEGAPEAKDMALVRTIPRMTAGRASLLGLMRRYLEASMDPGITLLELHKLMYFMQAAGEPLRLKYVKGPYGPYATNLRHVLSEIEGHFISGYGDGDDAPTRPIEPKQEIFPEAESFLKRFPDTEERFDRVAALIQGFESPYAMELLSTVHWVANQENAATALEALSSIHEWNSRKRMFTAREVSIAWHALDKNRWLPKEA